MKWLLLLVPAAGAVIWVWRFEVAFAKRRAAKYDQPHLRLVK